MRVYLYIKEYVCFTVATCVSYFRSAHELPHVFYLKTKWSVWSPKSWQQKHLD